MQLTASVNSLHDPRGWLHSITIKDAVYHLRTPLRITDNSGIHLHSTTTPNEKLVSYMLSFAYKVENEFKLIFVICDFTNSRLL